MTDAEKAAGRVLMVGIPGAVLDRPTEKLLERIRPGGVILFQRNLETPERLAELQAALAEILPPPRLLALDQEGGRVNRLEPWIGATPVASELTVRGGEAAFRFGRATASVLVALGFNLDFAPVVDLCEPGASNGIGDRSFGADPAATSVLAGSFLDGLQQGGVAGCLKHFPGLGDTPVDSHMELPTCGRSRIRLEQEDLVPFRNLSDRAACVMVGHAHYTDLETGSVVPATLSPGIVGGLLREDLGFRGLVVSDDMEMGAVSAMDADGRAAVLSVAAGCDLVLYCADPVRALRAQDALEDAAGKDRSFATRLGRAAQSVRQTAARWPARRPDLRAWQPALEEIRESVAAPGRTGWEA